MQLLLTQRRECSTKRRGRSLTAREDGSGGGGEADDGRRVRAAARRGRRQSLASKLSAHTETSSSGVPSVYVLYTRKAAPA
jgi:hypothetical protein